MFKPKKWLHINKQKEQLPTPDWYVELENQYIHLIDKKSSIEGEIQKVKNDLIQCMHNDKYQKIDTTKTISAIISEHSIFKIDTNRLKKELPQIFLEYSKPSKTKEHLRIIVKKEK